jgi:hypothetical protein
LISEARSVDFTTLVAGPAQAGSQSAVGKPGIGPAAGAGIAAGAGQPDASGEAGFASLVALALGQLDGVSSAASAAAGRETSPSAAHEGATAAAEAEAEAAANDDVPAVDAPVDAVTLSVLIALATPIATPIATPTPTPPVATSAAEATPLIANGAALGAAGSDAVADRANALAGTTATAAGPAPISDFRNALASAVAAPAAPAGGAPSVAAAAPAGQPGAPAGPSSAPSGAPGAPTAPEGAGPAPAATISDEASAALEALGATSPGSGPASTPGPAQSATTADAAVTVAAAPPSGTAVPRSRATAPASPHPLQQPLAAIAATQPAVEASVQVAGGTPPQADAVAATLAAVGSAAAPVRGGADEARITPVPSGTTPASPVAAFPSSADAGSTGEGSSEGGAAGFARAVVASGLELRLDTPPTAVGPVSADALASGTPPVAGLGMAGDTLLRPIDAPAAQRLEQALSSVDPDVRNLQAMVRTVRLFTAGNGATEARLNLEPDHLGPVALTVRIEQGNVSAHFRAETPAAQRWIETHQQDLRNGLRDQGLEVKELTVTTDPDARRERRQEAPARPARARRGPASADTPRFEVMV